MQKFGGTWTDDKLRRVSAYLKAYNIALQFKPSRAKPFQRIYIDAFAGSGYRVTSASTEPSLLDEDTQVLAKGSARVALEVNPPFDRYIFIERSAERFQELIRLKNEFSSLSGSMVFLNEDANLSIRKLCAETDWRVTRAVVFLDPFGMQVDWATVQALGATAAVDLWYLVPTGMGLSRLARHDGLLPPAWQQRMERMTGDPNWKSAFYRHRDTLTLFGKEATTERDAGIKKIESYFLHRLGTCFAGVARHGVTLGPKGRDMYLLAFACANEQGKEIALRIAGHIIGRRRP